MISFRMRGNNLTVRGLERYARKNRKKTEEALYASALVVQNEARRLVVQGPKTGRTYIKRRTIAHRASAPGEPPASDTGTLVRNIIVNAEFHANRIRVIANTNYAGFLEWGTRRIKPRPFMFRALLNKSAEIKRIFEVSFRRQ